MAYLNTPPTGSSFRQGGGTFPGQSVADENSVNDSEMWDQLNQELPGFVDTLTALDPTKQKGNQFLQSEEGQNAMSIWSQSGGPTDTAVESLQQLFNMWNQRNGTVPSDLLK